MKPDAPSAEVDVLQLIAAGNANKQIAAQFSIAEDIVKGRIKNIVSKLGGNDRTHAANDRRKTRKYSFLGNSKESREIQCRNHGRSL